MNLDDLIDLFLRAMKMLRILFAVALTSTLLWSCKSDLELNAPYKPMTVVFGLLDPSADTQWVKINKTWLGDGNNLNYALIRDSSEYNFDEFTGTVERVKGGAVTHSWMLDSITLSNKTENGIFFGPEYTAYYFVPEDGLGNPDGASYRLFLDFENKEDVEGFSTVIDAPLSNNSNITQPPAGFDGYELNLANVTPDGTHYNSFEFKWNSSDNAGRYELSLNVHYIEYVWDDVAHTNLISEKQKSINWFLGSVLVPADNQNAQLKKEVKWESFYRMLRNVLNEDTKITRQFGIWDEDAQKLRAFDMVLTVANDELNTYLEVNEPVTGIIQERPEYTNLSNGLGLWASRTQQKVLGLKPSLGTIRELVEGEYTATLNFCSGNPFDDYSCD